MIREVLPPSISGVQIELEKESSEEELPFFHYTHGLKNHFGNCQRLLHGHRSALKVYRTGLLAPELVHLLLEEFGPYPHFHFRENSVNAKFHGLEGVHPELKEVQIHYKGSQGIFEATLPAERVYFLPMESTVENLSLYFLEILQRKFGKKSAGLQVEAFEGIGKGAQSFS